MLCEKWSAHKSNWDMGFWRVCASYILDALLEILLPRDLFHLYFLCWWKFESKFLVRDTVNQLRNIPITECLGVVKLSAGRYNLIAMIHWGSLILSSNSSFFWYFFFSINVNILLKLLANYCNTSASQAWKICVAYLQRSKQHSAASWEFHP